MSEAKYTRGPWTTSRGGVITAPIPGLATRTQVVAYTSIGEGPEARGNKYVIAASPEMFELLQQIRRSVWLDQKLGPVVCIHEDSAMMADIDRLILKAGGPA